MVVETGGISRGIDRVKGINRQRETRVGASAGGDIEVAVDVPQIPIRAGGSGSVVHLKHITAARAPRGVAGGDRAWAGGGGELAAVVDAHRAVQSRTQRK